MPAQLTLNALSSNLIPGEIEYAVLTPPGYNKNDKSAEPLPLLINMHGGGLDRNYLALPEIVAMYEKLWEEGALPPMVIACYSARGSWHFNYHDGTEKWEDFVFEFIDYMHNNYNTALGQKHTYLTGISMGAMGSLRLTLKYPDKIAAVAAMEGIINPVLNYDDLQPRNYAFQHNSPPEEQAKRWGWPVDKDYYHANNHANIAQDNAQAIKASGTNIFLECGDHDYFNGHDGAEFVHRVLWDNRIEHEYRLLHNCDHEGSSLLWRTEEAHRWLGRVANKQLNPQPMPQPTDAQINYFTGLMAGEITRLPNEEEVLGIHDDAVIPLRRQHLPKFITDFVDVPLDGIFRKPKQ